jgi:hypothetical protein
VDRVRHEAAERGPEPAVRGAADGNRLPREVNLLYILLVVLVVILIVYFARRA